MYNPKISVVIPLYNKRNHILDTLHSVAEQTQPATEILVIDDGSTDGGDNLVKEQPIKNLTLIQQENAGVSHARNRGINLATGDYVAFIDADDHWAPQFLEEICSMIAKLPGVGLYATAYQYYDGDNKYVDPKIRAKKTTQAHIMENYFEIGSRGELPFITSSVCIPKSTFTEIGDFPVGEPMGEDQDLWCRIAARKKIAYSPKILSFYHRDSQNRAMDNIRSIKECPFSERLHQYAINQVKNETLRQHMIDYTASHLLHIASINQKSGNSNDALRILNDPRCWRKPIKKIWWTLKSYKTLFFQKNHNTKKDKNIPPNIKRPS